MTKDEIFAAMEKAYTGAGSTVEGSFAGDLLRACADGCAELWSTEIDGLEERAFVASAAGEWLTRVCADRGVERRAGEPASNGVEAYFDEHYPDERMQAIYSNLVFSEE